MKKPAILFEIVLGAWLAACGSSAKNPSFGDVGDAAHDSAHEAMTFADVGVDAPTASNSADSDAMVVDGNSTVLVGFDGEVNGDSSCANSTITAPIVPPLLLFLLDRSGSMCNLPSDPNGTGVCYYPLSVQGTGSKLYGTNMQFSESGFASTKYGQLRTALDQVFGSLPQDWQVAVSFFTAPGMVVTANGECGNGPDDYGTPTIGFDTVGNNHPLLKCWTGLTDITDPACAAIPTDLTEVNYAYKNSSSTLAPAYPNGNTPMNDALAGAIAFMQGQTSNSSRVVVLVTDGEPNCDPYDPSGNYTSSIDAPDVVATAASGATGSPPVLTYTIGVPGADNTFLASVANNGGGDNYSASSGTYVTDLVDAFNKISKAAMSCTFNVPVPADNQVVDPSAVSVNLTVNGVTAGVSSDSADPNGYWAYTNGGQQITLYGAACNSVKTDTSASVQILVACDTVQQVEGGVVVCSTAGGACPCCLGYHCGTGNTCAPNVIIQ